MWTTCISYWKLVSLAGLEAYLPRMYEWVSRSTYLQCKWLLTMYNYSVSAQLIFTEFHAPCTVAVCCSGDGIAWRSSRRHRLPHRGIVRLKRAENGQWFYGPYARLSAVARATVTAGHVCWKYALYSDRGFSQWRSRMQKKMEQLPTEDFQSSLLHIK